MLRSKDRISFGNLISVSPATGLEATCLLEYTSSTFWKRDRSFDLADGGRNRISQLSFHPSVVHTYHEYQIPETPWI
jgi:hypothetical protein